MGGAGSGPVRTQRGANHSSLFKGYFAASKKLRVTAFFLHFMLTELATLAIFSNRTREIAKQAGLGKAG